jgi:ABC-2 type transport system permease protein
MSFARHLQWSIRRELWESRSLYLAPIALALVILAGFAVNAYRYTDRMRVIQELVQERQIAAAMLPFSLAASVIVATAWLVAGFYCLDALHGERRDRSILFWKSMPVSDLTSVMAKMGIPLAVTPLIACVVALAAQVLLLLLAAAMLAFNGVEMGAMFSRLPYGVMVVSLFYGTAVQALWFAPIFAYLLMVSAWAKRSPFAWAFIPVFGAWAVESITSGTQYVSNLLRYRFSGGEVHAFASSGQGGGSVTRLSQMTPLDFLSAPGMLVGLVFAAGFIAVAVQLRRRREGL